MIIQLDKTGFKRRVWQRAFDRTMIDYGNKVKEAKNEAEKTKAREQLLEKYIFFGIKCFGVWSEEIKHIKKVPDKTLKKMFEQYSRLMDHIELVTPRQFIQWFPVSKEYDGERWESKDYFYTMAVINDAGIDKPIEEGFHFLWDYQNKDTKNFLVNYTSIISEMRKRETGLSLMDEFLNYKGDL